MINNVPISLKQHLPNLCMCKSHLEFVNTDSLRKLDSVGLGKGLRIGISNQPPGDGEVVNLKLRGAGS